jgi:adenine phosphoribosyltransferase
MFRDITPLLSEPAAFSFILDRLVEHVREADAQVIVGIESRGFIFGCPVADRLKLPFVPVRKPGKLPAKRMSVEYSLEYGENQLDIHADAIRGGQRAYIVDDLLATGGTARATAKLVELVGGVVAGFGFVVELDDLGGLRQLEGYEAFSVVHYGAGE